MINTGNSAMTITTDNDDTELDFCDRYYERERRGATDRATRALTKLTLAQLNVLWAHYFKSPLLRDELTQRAKRGIVCELADMMLADPSSPFAFD